MALSNSTVTTCELAFDKVTVKTAFTVKLLVPASVTVTSLIEIVAASAASSMLVPIPVASEMAALAALVALVAVFAVFAVCAVAVDSNIAAIPAALAALVVA